MSTQQTTTSFSAKHTFTAQEKEQKLQQMLAAMKQKEEIEADLKTTKSAYKAKIDAKDAEIKLTSNLLNAGFEDRTYQCILTKNFELQQREYNEIGTGALIGTEPLSAEDYQIQMDLEEKAIRENNVAADQEWGEQEVEVNYDQQTEGSPFDEPQYVVDEDGNPLDYEEDILTEAQPFPAVDEAEVIPETKPTNRKEKNEVKPIEIKETPKEVEPSPFDFESDSKEDDSDPFDFGDL